MMEPVLKMGLCSNIITPTLDALRAQVHCDYEQISEPLAAKNAGLLVASAFAAFIMDRYKRHCWWWVGLFVLGSSALLAAVPWCSNLRAMTAIFFCMGACYAPIGNGGNVITADLWGSAAVVPLMLVHMGYSAGTILGPIIAGPFLREPTLNGSSAFSSYGLLSSLNPSHGSGLGMNSKYMMNYSPYYHADGDNHRQYTSDVYSLIASKTPYEVLVPNVTNYTSTQFTTIFAPYSIVAAFGLLTASLCFLLALFNTQTTTNEEVHPRLVELLNPASCANGNKVYGIIMLSLLAVQFIFLSGKEIPVFNLITVMAEDGPLKFSIEEGVFFTTMFFVSYCCGRLVFSFIGLVFRVQVLVFVEFGLMFISQFATILFAYRSKEAFWVTMMLYAFFSGPMFPTSMGWINRYLNMTNMAFAIQMMGSGGGAWLFSWLSGYLFQHYSGQSLLYLSLASCIMATVVTIVMQIIASHHGDRFDREDLTLVVNINQTDEVERLLYYN